jgi:hypothetical protein
MEVFVTWLDEYTLYTLPKYHTEPHKYVQLSHINKTFETKCLRR